MPSIKVKYRPSVANPLCGTIYYQVLHTRTPRQISTNFRLNLDEWDPKHLSVVISPTSPRRQLLLSIRDHIRWDLERLNRIIRRLSQTTVDFTSEQIVEAFRTYRSKYSFSNYMQAAITMKMQKGMLTTAQHYRAAFNSFMSFLEALPDDSFSGLDGVDFMLDSLNSEIMELYEAWQRSRGLCPNTTSIYIRIIRAVYRRAVDDGIIDDRRPFRRVYTGVDRTVKRALPLPVISKIKTLDLTLNPKLDLARDMFMLSFYLRGMSFIDMAYLRKSDLADGKIIYHRRKTKQRLTITWTKEMQQILDKYPENESDFLLPIITRKDIDPRVAYLNASCKFNSYIKQIGRLLQSDDSQSWSFYRARHSWASAARDKGVPVSVISEGMGHESEATTRIYLASLDTSVVDRANALVISTV